MKFRFKHIGDRIFVLVGMSVCAGLVWMSLFHTQKQEQLIKEQHEQTMYLLTRSISEGLEAIMLSGNADIARKFASHLKHINEIKELTIIKKNGLEAFNDNETLLDVNKRLGEDEFTPRDKETKEQILSPDNPALQAVLTTASQHIEKKIDPKTNTPYMTVLAPILNKKECHRCHSSESKVRGVIQLTFPMTHIATKIEQSHIQGIIILVTALAGVLTLITLLIRFSVVRPIVRVTQAMSEVAAGNLQHRVPEISSDELGTMAMNFNHMSNQLATVLHDLKNEQEKLTTIILSAREGIIVTNRQGEIALVNPSAERLLGKTTNTLRQEGFSHILDDPEHMAALLDENRENVPTIVVFKERILNIYAATIHISSGERIGSAAMIRDISKEKKLEHQLRMLSTTDALTGLYNRRRFDEVLIKEWNQAKRYNLFFSLLLFDVDHFKRFNDQHGHDQGDRVLKSIGQAMQELFRDVDHPCRYGGEEFVVILPNTGFPGANLAAERLRQTIEALMIDGLKVTISIGVAIHPGVGQDAADMVKQADIALYASKQADRNRVSYAPGCEISMPNSPPDTK